MTILPLLSSLTAPRTPAPDLARSIALSGMATATAPEAPKAGGSALDALKQTLDSHLATIKSVQQTPPTQMPSMLPLLSALNAIGTRGGAGGGGGFGGGGNNTYGGPTSFSPLHGGHFPIMDTTPSTVPNPSQVTPEIQRVAAEAWARWPGLRDMGTYVVKDVAGTNTPSYHSYGDAIDLGGSAEQMRELATWASRNAAKMGISQVIYNGRIWTTDQGWHGYSGVDPHTSHVHITGPLSYNDTTPSYPTITWNPPAPAKPQHPSRKPEAVANRRRRV